MADSRKEILREKKIQLSAYSGYKENERPMSFVVGEKKIEVVRFLDAWIEETYADRVRRRYFILQGDDGCTYRLFQEMRTGDWYMSD